MKLLKNIREKYTKVYKNILKLKNKNENKKKRLIFSVIIILWLLNIYNIYANYTLEKEKHLIEKQLLSYKIDDKKIKINRNYFNDNIKLNNYSQTRYKIQKEWKNIIKNIRNIHKSPVLISKEFQNKELCAWYIWELTQKIWGKKSIYSIWMQNTKKWQIAQAWELPYFYEAFGWKILIDLGEKFSLKEKNYLEKISLEDLKEFFAKAFSEKALFWDIWFLYSKTKYTDFLKNWNSNSHITKNMWVSDFEIIFSKIDKNKSNLENLMENIWCNKKFMKYVDLLKNYKMFLNNKQIVFYNKEFYYINSDNSLWEKVLFKYLDKIIYKDITIAHFFEGKAHVDSLLQFSCILEFYPINVISINSRMIEKM